MTNFQKALQADDIRMDPRAMARCGEAMKELIQAEK